MPEQSVIVWDLETVPDLAAAARMLDMGTATDAEVREALGSGFPKHPLHQIACIGALIARHQPQGWRVEALGSRQVAHRAGQKNAEHVHVRVPQARSLMHVNEPKAQFVYAQC